MSHFYNLWILLRNIQICLLIMGFYITLKTVWTWISLSLFNFSSIQINLWSSDQTVMLNTTEYLLNSTLNRYINYEHIEKFVAGWSWQVLMFSLHPLKRPQKENRKHLNWSAWSFRTFHDTVSDFGTKLIFQNLQRVAWPARWSATGHSSPG